MRDKPNEPLNCETARCELPALLYDDIEPEIKREVERHLDSCEACQAELEMHHRTLRLLDTWSVDAGEATGMSAAQRRRRRVGSKWRPILLGAVAGLALFALLVGLGAEARYADGRLVIALGRGSGISDESRTGVVGTSPVLRAVAREEVNSRCGEIARVLDDYLADFEEQEAERRVMLARAVEFKRHEDRREQDAILQAIAGHVESESLQTRDALRAIQNWIVLKEQSVDTPTNREVNP